MKSKMRLAILLAVILIPVAALAETTGSSSSSGSTSSNLSGGPAVGLVTPLGKTTPETFIGSLIKTLLGLTGVIALVMFIWGGFLWMTAAGNTKRVDQAKKTIIWATVGLLLIFGSYSIVRFVIQAMESTTTK